MARARMAWERWGAEDPALGVVEDLAELPEWTRDAPWPAKDDVLARLAALSATEPDAVTMLAWLLLPGATRIAVELRDLHADIDALVAGQLWIEASAAHELSRRGIARAILRRIRSEILAELGVGDAAERRDRLWSRAVLDDVLIDGTAASPDLEPPTDYTLLELLKDAFFDQAVVGFDMRLLWDLAQTADRLGAPAHRGRMGLTSPAVVEAFASERHLNARSVRRRATESLDRLREYAAVRDDVEGLARWKRRHPHVDLTAREEMELALVEEHAWWLMTGPEYLAPDDAWDRASPHRIPRHTRRA